MDSVFTHYLQIYRRV